MLFVTLDTLQGHSRTFNVKMWNN